MKRTLWIPLIIVSVLSGILFLSLWRDPKEIPSPFIGKPAPSFTAPVLSTSAAASAQPATFSPAQMQGKVWLLNVWASWCVPCRVEHPLLNDWAQTHPDVPLVGLNYKDKPEDATRWLAALGNPFAVIATDLKGQIGIDYGVYGVPETFVIDGQGIIRYKHVGPLTADDVQTKLLPEVKKWQ